jgi:hypothetical protein
MEESDSYIIKPRFPEALITFACLILVLSILSVIFSFNDTGTGLIIAGVSLALCFKFEKVA